MSIFLFLSWYHCNYAGKICGSPEKTQFSPRRLRPKRPKTKTAAEIAADLFEADFDSPKPSSSIQFNYNWGNGRENKRRSRRTLNLPPTGRALSLPARMRAPLEEIIVNDNNDNERIACTIYRTPKTGWNGLVRRVVQHGYNRMGRPPRLNAHGNNLWSGPNGVISQLQEYAGTSGWRNRKVIRQILEKIQEHGDKYDAGVRVKMRLPRKRKLGDAEINLAGQMLRSGSGSKWATTFCNHQILGRNESNTVTSRTLERTLQKKYDAKVHRRGKKGTGSKDKTSIWARARLAFCKQLKSQLGKWYMMNIIYEYSYIHNVLFMCVCVVQMPISNRLI